MSYHKMDNLSFFKLLRISILQVSRVIVCPMSSCLSWPPRLSDLIINNKNKLITNVHWARWLRGNARDSHSGGPGFKSRGRPTWLRFLVVSSILTLIVPRAWEIGYTQSCIKCRGNRKFILFIFEVVKLSPIHIWKPLHAFHSRVKALTFEPLPYLL